jgi:hypothetical protein
MFHDGCWECAVDDLSSQIGSLRTQLAASESARAVERGALIEAYAALTDGSTSGVFWREEARVKIEKGLSSCAAPKGETPPDETL